VPAFFNKSYVTVADNAVGVENGMWLIVAQNAILAASNPTVAWYKFYTVDPRSPDPMYKAVSSFGNYVLTEGGHILTVSNLATIPALSYVTTIPRFRELAFNGQGYINVHYCGFTGNKIFVNAINGQDSNGFYCHDIVNAPNNWWTGTLFTSTVNDTPVNSVWALGNNYLMDVQLFTGLLGTLAGYCWRRPIGPGYVGGSETLTWSNAFVIDSFVRGIIYDEENGSFYIVQHRDELVFIIPYSIYRVIKFGDGGSRTGQEIANFGLDSVGIRAESIPSWSTSKVRTQFGWQAGTIIAPNKDLSNSNVVIWQAGRTDGNYDLRGWTGYPKRIAASGSEVMAADVVRGSTDNIAIDNVHYNNGYITTPIFNTVEKIGVNFLPEQEPHVKVPASLIRPIDANNIEFTNIFGKVVGSVALADTEVIVVTENTV